MKRVWLFIFAGVALGELTGRYQQGLMLTVFLIIFTVTVICLTVRGTTVRGGAARGGDMQSKTVQYVAVRDVYTRGASVRSEDAQGTAMRCATMLGVPMQGAHEQGADIHSPDMSSARLSGILRYKYAPYVMLLLVCVTLGNVRMIAERYLYEQRDTAESSSVLRRLLTQTDYLDELSGSKSCTWRCEVESIVPRSEGYLIKSGQVNIYCDDISDLGIGNIAEFIGQMSRIGAPRNPGEWDYSASGMASGITHRLYAREYRVIDSSISLFGQRMYELRSCLLERLSSAFGGEGAEDDAAFLRAALLGDKSLMSDELYEMYKSNGIAHLLAISGLHVSIIGMSLYRHIHKAVKRLYRVFFLNRREPEEILGIPQNGTFLLPDCIAGICSAVFLVLYSMLTGSSVSTVRAVFMMIMMFIAGVSGRSYDLLSAAAVAAVCIVLYRPYELFGCSFLLSFGAIAAIGGPASYIIKRYNIKNSIVCSLVVSLCIQLVTLPIASAYFFEISTYGIFLNLIVIPLMTYVVWSGLAALVLPAAGGAAHYLLHSFKWLCTLLSGLPGRTVLLGRPAVLLTALLTSLTPLKSSDSITFLDVGQGDGIYLHIGDEHMLVDAGSSSSKSMGRYTLEPFLKSSRADVLDRVFVTHADADHINGIRYLLTESDISIGRLYLPVQALIDPAYAELTAEAEQAGTDLVYLKCGDIISIGDEGATVTCLWPTEEVGTDDMNNESLVLLLRAGDVSAYLAGDAGQEAEREILAEIEAAGRDELPAGRSGTSGNGITSASTDILKCGHHGSRTSSSSELIDALQPSWAVLSYKKGNTYGHPHDEVVERLESSGAQLLHTAESGAVTFMLTGRRVLVRTFLKQNTGK